ncbi:hypothetical protein JL721_11782 [Aureococcus anophagefferens]|nr:hypothetical protein JL721_11782 [Aureococcus anophagefferens]
MTPAKESQALRKGALTTIERCVMDVVGTVVGETRRSWRTASTASGASGSSALSNKFSTTMETTFLFDHPTIGAVAAVIVAANAAERRAGAKKDDITRTCWRGSSLAEVAQHLVKLTQPGGVGDELSDIGEADFDDDAPGGHLRAAKAVAVLPAFSFTLPGPTRYGSFVRLGAFFDVVGLRRVAARGLELDHHLARFEASYGALRGNHAGDKQCRSALMNDPCGLFMGAGGFVMSAAINTTGLRRRSRVCVWPGRR